MFKKFFKPKWQSAKPLVRIQAIDNLNLGEADDLCVLDLLAKGDVESSVRAVAYQRTQNIAKLLSYIQQEKDDAAQQAAIDQLLGLLASSDVELDERLESVVRGLDTQALASLVEKTKNVELGLLALEGIQEEVVLQVYAVSLSVSALRQVAAERLTTEAVLEAVLKESKGKDKSVYRIIKNKLNVIHDAQKQVENRDQQLAELCKSVESLARLPFDPLYIATFEHLQKQWSRMQNFSSADSKLRFQRASELCRQTVDATTAEETEQRETDQRLREATQERMAACDQLEEALKQITNKDSFEAEDVPALSALLRTQQVRWDEAANISASAVDERKRFHRAIAELEKITTAVVALKEHGEELTAIATKILELVPVPSSEMKRLKKTFDRLSSAISWPTAIAKSEVLILRDKAAAHFDGIQNDLLAKEKEAIGKLKGVLDNLREAVENGHLKPANKWLRDANRHIKHLPMKQVGDYQKKLRELTSKVNELRDWQGFASAPKKEQLCESMEALSDADMEPQALANRIKRLQSEWKMLGASPDGQAVWERFSAAADKAYEPCREYFDSLSEIRAGNLASRNAVVTQLKNYIAELDWEAADWSAVNEVYEVSKQEWRRYSPVDRKDGKPAQDQFNGLLQQLRERLDQEFSRNENKRRKLIETAEALVEQDNLGDAINQAKKLQQQWKVVGLVSRKEDAKLWRKFRAVCDKIFARRDQERQAVSEEKDKSLTDALYLCEQLEQLAESDVMDLDACKSDYRQMKKKYAELATLPREQVGEIKKRFSSASDACEKLFSGAEKLKLQDQFVELWRKISFCDDLEAILMSSEQAGVSAEDDVVEWDADADLPKGAQGIKQRYQALVALSQNSELVTDSVLTENADRLRELTVLLEIEAGLETPVAEKQYRMELQVSRLSGGLSQRKTQDLSANDLLTQYQFDWSGVGPVTAEARTEYTGRFKTALEQLK